VVDEKSQTIASSAFQRQKLDLGINFREAVFYVLGSEVHEW
jgi:hypothetical protein